VIRDALQDAVSMVASHFPVNRNPAKT